MTKREQLLAEISEVALQNELKYQGCTQAVLAALNDKLGVGSQEVLKAGTALAGGVAGRGETCGALTGAILAIGSVVGRKQLEDTDQIGIAMASATKVYLRFQKEVGHTICQEIHKILYGRVYRLYLPEELEALHNRGGDPRHGCPRVCAIAAGIAADVILDIRGE